MNSLGITLPRYRAARRLADFWELSKPGIAGAVMLTAFFGFLLGSPSGGIRWGVLFHTLLGTALAAAGAGAVNMLLEQETDALMERTKGRPIPSGRVAPHEAFLLGAFSAGLGIVHLCLSVGMLPGFLSALTVVLYLVFYTPAKVKSPFCSVVGAVSGALPPLIGFSAASGELTAGAWSLFAILFLWQFPHLISLSWLYRKDNERAGMKMLPRGGRFALASALLLFAAGFLPYFLGLSGPLYLLPSAALSGLYLYKSARFNGSADTVSARGLFLTSIAYMPLLLASILIGHWGLPSLLP